MLSGEGMGDATHRVEENPLKGTQNHKIKEEGGSGILELSKRYAEEGLGRSITVCRDLQSWRSDLKKLQEDEDGDHVQMRSWGYRKEEWLRGVFFGIDSRIPMLSGIKFFCIFYGCFDDVVKWNGSGRIRGFAWVWFKYDAGEVFRWWSRRWDLKNSLFWVVNGVKEQKALSIRLRWNVRYLLWWFFYGWREGGILINIYSVDRFLC